MSPETVFPSLAASEKSSSQSSPDSERKTGSNKLDKKQEERKKRRNARQNKLKNRNNLSLKETVQEDVTEKEAQSGPSSSASSMPLIENHFHSEPSEKEAESAETVKKSDGEASTTQSLEDYVVISSADVLGSGSKRKIGDVDSSEAGDQCMEAMEAEEEIPPSQFSNLGSSSKQLSESLQNLNLKLEGDGDVGGEVGSGYTGEEDVDFDFPPAVDGIGGSASDEEEGNGVAQLDLGLPTYDKFGSFQLAKSIEEDDELEKKLVAEKTTTADEGFSEGENSMSVDNDATRRISQGPSASSSRNSLSDSDETSKSSSNDEAQKTTTVNSRIPKVTKCPCSRQQSISCPPENLTIHFKRFQMSQGGYPTKINDHVSYPMILDLTPFCSRDADKSEGVFDEEGQVLYSLYGIVEHSGSMNWGHYVAYVKSSECEKRWFHISDSSVSVTSYNRVTSVDAYILFYERIRGTEKTRRLSVNIPSPTRGEKEEDQFAWNTNPTSGTYSTFWDEKPVRGIVPPAVEENWDTDQTKFQVVGSRNAIDDAEAGEIQIPCSLTDFVAEAGPPGQPCWDSEGESGQPDFSSNWSMPEQMKEVTEWKEGCQGRTALESTLPIQGCSPPVTSTVSSFIEVGQPGSGTLTFHRADEAEEESREEEEVPELR